VLNGVKIIEFEGVGPGPFAGMHLADLGAEVIVVNRPGKPKTPGIPERQILDRGKRSIELDLKNPKHIGIAKALVAQSDGLIEGLRPGVMERLGLGPDVCAEINPALMYGRMTGWGQSGTMARLAGHDLNYVSMSGAAWYASEPGAAPFTPPTLLGDIGGGALYLVIGLLSGILRARETGKGCVVDAAILDGSAHMMNLLMTLRQSGGMSPQRGKSLLDGSHWSRTYQTSDGGFMSVQCLEPQFYADFLRLLGEDQNPELANQYDPKLWPRQTEIVAAIFKSRTRTEWEAVFAGSDACTAPVLSPDEALKYQHRMGRTIWRDHGGVLQAAAAPRFSDQPDWQVPDVPLRGGDTQAILSELEIDPGDWAT
jgi:crotonobetainyl-CoA:carnitine CoA-transferase CaiB-like acyl-CoA transferase